ncbi:hypothetical protein [Chroococcidiopsis sp. TS-821]|uniref:hypothetical protein n=2 Tax=Chroococcidiopsis sp. TS-821 TaxID=1378066 RepID=UPI0011AFD371|nr:hypothetical protein [Chroococcidiopsis sp. TS-821]
MVLVSFGLPLALPDLILNLFLYISMIAWISSGTVACGVVIAYISPVLRFIAWFGDRPPANKAEHTVVMVIRKLPHQWYSRCLRRI